MLTPELLSDLRLHKRDLKDIGVCVGGDTNVLLDRFLRDFCDNSQTLTSTTYGGKKYTNFESAQLLLQRLTELC